jgi:hypothetical protein
MLRFDAPRVDPGPRRDYCSPFQRATEGSAAAHFHCPPGCRQIVLV